MAASDNLFIGDLPPTINDAQVKEIFSAYGTVLSCKAIPPKIGGTKGAALVKFSSVEEAQWVQENLNGNLAEGLDQPIVVAFSKSGGAGKGGGGGGIGGGAGAGGKGGAAAAAGWGKGAPAAASWAGSSGSAGSDNLFIGDLPPDINESQVKEIFSAYGTVLSCKVIPPKAGGTKGAALVKFSSPEEAQRVQENLNGNMAEGLEQPIVVHFAKSGGGAGGGGGPRSSPYPPAKGCGKGPGGSDFRSFFKGLVKGGCVPGGGRRPDDHCIFVKNLPSDTTDFNLYEMFAPFGAIAVQGVKAMIKEDGSCTGVGFVDFQDPEVAGAAAATLNGIQLQDGNVLVVSQKKDKGGAKGSSRAGGKTLGSAGSVETGSFYE